MGGCCSKKRKLKADDDIMAEIMGLEKDPAAYMKFEYWGAWGYRGHVVDAINEVERVLPNKFQYVLLVDSGVTGRLEVNIQRDKDCSDEGVLVFSKLQSKAFPMQDRENKEMFISMVKTEFENLDWPSCFYV